MLSVKRNRLFIRLDQIKVGGMIIKIKKSLKRTFITLVLNLFFTKVTMNTFCIRGKKYIHT